MPRRVVLELRVVAEHRPPPVRRRRGRARSAAPASSSATSPSVQLVARAGRVLDREVVAEVAVVAAQRLDHQVVDREPDRARASSSCRRTGRSSTRPARSRRVAVTPSTSHARTDARRGTRDSDAEAVVGEELVRVEHRARGPGAAGPATTTDSSRQPVVLQRRHVLRRRRAYSGRLLDEPLERGRELGQRASVAGPSVVAAASGISPTIDRTAQRHAAPSARWSTS